MATRDFNLSDVFIQLEQDFLRTTEDAFQSVRFRLRTDMYETDEALIVKVELAGVRPENISVLLSEDDRTLIISGERMEPDCEQQDRVRCYHLEIFYGRFEREVPLPSQIHFERENIKANFKEGFLTISIPKKEEPLHPTRVINVTVGE